MLEQLCGPLQGELVRGQVVRHRRAVLAALEVRTVAAHADHDLAPLRIGGQ